MEFLVLHRWNNRPRSALAASNLTNGGAMADPVARYKEYAAECLRIAQQASDNEQKARLLEMAAAWHRLAEAASQRDPKE